MKSPSFFPSPFKISSPRRRSRETDEEEEGEEKSAPFLSFFLSLLIHLSPWIARAHITNNNYKLSAPHLPRKNDDGRRPGRRDDSSVDRCRSSSIDALSAKLVGLRAAPLHHGPRAPPWPGRVVPYDGPARPQLGGREAGRAQARLDAALVCPRRRKCFFVFFGCGGGNGGGETRCRCSCRFRHGARLAPRRPRPGRGLELRRARGARCRGRRGPGVAQRRSGRRRRLFLCRTLLGDRRRRRRASSSASVAAGLARGLGASPASVPAARAGGVRGEEGSGGTGGWTGGRGSRSSRRRGRGSSAADDGKGDSANRRAPAAARALLAPGPRRRRLRGCRPPLRPGAGPAREAPRRGSGEEGQQERGRGQKWRGK